MCQQLDRGDQGGILLGHWGSRLLFRIVIRDAVRVLGYFKS